jgi:hypothetical protein
VDLAGTVLSRDSVDCRDTPGTRLQALELQDSAGSQAKAGIQDSLDSAERLDILGSRQLVPVLLDTLDFAG